MLITIIPPDRVLTINGDSRAADDWSTLDAIHAVHANLDMDRAEIEYRAIDPDGPGPLPAVKPANRIVDAREFAQIFGAFLATAGLHVAAHVMYSPAPAAAPQLPELPAPESVAVADPMDAPLPVEPDFDIAEPEPEPEPEAVRSTLRTALARAMAAGDDAPLPEYQPTSEPPPAPQSGPEIEVLAQQQPAGPIAGPTMVPAKRDFLAMQYELAIRARNGDVWAQKQLAPAAEARGVPVAVLASMIITDYEAALQEAAAALKH